MISRDCTAGGMTVKIRSEFSPERVTTKRWARTPPPIPLAPSFPESARRSPRSRQADVEAEPQVDREPRAAAAGELRRREVVGAEQHGGSRPDLVERARSDAHRSH